MGAASFFKQTLLPFLLMALLVASSVGAVWNEFIPISAWLLLASWVFGLICIFGLFLWCANNIRNQPELVRFTLDFVMVISVLALASLILKPALIYGKDAREKPQAVARVFRQLLIEQKIKHPPATPDDFKISSKHGGLPCTIRYRDKDGKEHSYFVTKVPSQVWSFQSFNDPEPEILFPVDALLLRD